MEYHVRECRDSVNTSGRFVFVLVLNHFDAVKMQSLLSALLLRAMIITFRSSSVPVASLATPCFEYLDNRSRVKGRDVLIPVICIVTGGTFRSSLVCYV